MNGNPLYHGVFLAVAGALTLPLASAVLAGWVPPWLRRRTAGLRLRTYGLLSVFGSAAVNAVPRIADAPHDTVLIGDVCGMGLMVSAGALFLAAALKDGRAHRCGI